MKKGCKRAWFLSVLLLTLAFVFTLPAQTAGVIQGQTVYAAATYGSKQMEEYAREVAILVNRERRAKGLSPLKLSDKLSEVAILRAKETETLFSHTRPNGTSCFTAMDEAEIDYYYAGENIAYGQKTPEAVMNAWMNSEGHRNNILSETPNYLGVGVTYNNNRFYWVQLFASSGNLNGKVPADQETVTRITQHPANYTGREGDTATFTVKADGDGLTYQWQLSDDQGKTWRTSLTKSSTYTAKLSDKNDGRYLCCIVTDAYGNRLISNSAVMKIAKLTITHQPSDASAGLGAQVNFVVKATGESLLYQWQLSDNKGATWRNSAIRTSAYYTTLTAKHNGRYVRCIITDKYGNSAISDQAEMRVSPVKITGQPADVTASLGDQVKFTVKAKGDGLTYQWQLSDDSCATWRSSSTKTAIYTTTLSEKNNGRYVRCVVTDAYGNETVSGSAAMRGRKARFITQPASVTAEMGDRVSFSFIAEGDGLTYEWQLSDDHGTTWRKSSTKTATYSTTLSEKNNGRSLRCLITDKYGNQVVSQTVTMNAVTEE